jgi:hypothetical protein
MSLVELFQLYLSVAYMQAAIVACVICGLLAHDAPSLPQTAPGQMSLAAALAVLSLAWGLAWPGTLISILLSMRSRSNE